MGMFNDEEALNAIFPPLFAGDCPGRVPVVELEPLREAYLAQYEMCIRDRDNRRAVTPESQPAQAPHRRAF